MELGIGEIVIILVVVLLFFGPSKLPQLGEALGKGIRSFKKATSEAAAKDEPDTSSEPRSLPAASASASAPGNDAGKQTLHESVPERVATTRTAK